MFLGTYNGAKRSGQILILVLLIVVVALSVGLSVASRNITNLKTSTQTENSQRAFTAAEGGVEDVLSRLAGISTGIATLTSNSDTSGCTLSTGQADCSVQVGTLSTSVKVLSSAVYENQIELGDVGQIDLEGSTVTQVDIGWGKVDDASQVDASGPASIEVVQINDNAGTIVQSRSFYAGVAGRSETNASTPSGCTLSGYLKCARVTLYTVGTTKKLLRIKPFWVRTQVSVGAVGATALAPQVYDINSTASTANGITRKVQVMRTAKPNLPAVFDYVLFSEGDIIK